MIGRRCDTAVGFVVVALVVLNALALVLLVSLGLARAVAVLLGCRRRRSLRLGGDGGEGAFRSRRRRDRCRGSGGRNRRGRRRGRSLDGRGRRRWRWSGRSRLRSAHRGDDDGTGGNRRGNPERWPCCDNGLDGDSTGLRQRYLDDRLRDRQVLTRGRAEVECGWCGLGAGVTRKRRRSSHCPHQENGCQESLDTPHAFRSPCRQHHSKEVSAITVRGLNMVGT